MSEDKKNCNIFRFDSLLGIRGLGSCLIVFFHVWALCGFSGFSTQLNIVVSNFDSTLRLFFVLSSFSILCGYEKKLLSSEETLKRFYIRRFMKMAPLFYLAMILHIGISFVWNELDITLTSVLTSATFIYGFLPRYNESIVWAGWSLGIEWIFYISLPLFIILIRNKYTLIISTIISIIIMLNYDTLIGVGLDNSHINIVRYLPYFFAGAILYKSIPKIKELSEKKAMKYAFYPILFFMLFCSLYIAIRIGRDIGMLIGFTTIIAGAIYGYGRIINNKIFNFIGSISYGVYLLHMIVVRLIGKLGLIQVIANITDNMYLQYIITSLIALAITCFTAYIATKYLEKGILKHFSR